jgi:thioredoxin-related protein
LVRETHQDPAVIKTLNEDFIPVRLEGRSHMDLVQKYEVRGAPTTLLFSPDGQEKHRFMGFQAPDDYLKELKKAE